MTGTPAPSNPIGFPSLAKLAIENKILTEEQVTAALKSVAEENNKGRHLSFEDYLQENKLVSEETLKRLVAATVRHLDKQFGELAVRNGVVDEKHVDKALNVQKKAFAMGVLMPISDILMKWNQLTVQQRDTLLEAMATETYPHRERQSTPGSEIIPDSQDAALGNDLKEAGAEKHAPPKPETAKEDTDEELDPSLTIDIADKGLKAVLHIPEGLKGKPSLESVKDLLVQCDIRYGIVEDALLDVELEKAGKGPLSFIVARGLDPVQGKSATVTLHFDNNYLVPGKITEDGAIDFRERGDVPFVNEGDLIAEKTPAVKGKPGMDVAGQTIPVPDVEDISFKGGAGTQTSEDGYQIRAAIEGQPFMTVHGEVCVFKELHIKGDVDYSTGNIAFDGNVFVKGSIKEGFTVKGGNLTAKDVQGATLDIKGNIDISGGIIDSVITIGGNLQAMYMTGSKVDSYSDVLIKKEIIDSKIRTSGALLGEQLNVISTFVSAKKGIAVKRVGTDVSKPCTLRIGISDHTNKIVKNVKNILEETKKQLEEKQGAVEKLKDIQEKSQQDIMEKADKQDRLNRQKIAVESKLKDLGTDSTVSEERQKWEGLLSMTHSDITALDKVVADLFSQQENLTDKILAEQGQCEALIEKIEGLNKRIKDVKSWDKKSSLLPQARVSNEIQAQTTIAGPSTTLVLRETHRNVTIREIKRTSQPGVIWEMVIESN